MDLHIILNIDVHDEDPAALVSVVTDTDEASRILTRCYRDWLEYVHPEDVLLEEDLIRFFGETEFLEEPEAYWGTLGDEQISQVWELLTWAAPDFRVLIYRDFEPD